MADSTQDPVQEVKLRIRLPACVGANIDFVETHHTLQETLSDVKEALAAATQLNSVTNYSLVHEGVRVTESFDDFAPLSEVLSSKTGDLDLQLVEKPYTLKDIYEHLVRFREKIGMNFFDHAARAQGLAAGHTKFNQLGLKDINVAESESGKEDESSEEPVSAADVAAVKEVVDSLLTVQPLDLEKHAEGDSVLAKWQLPIKSLTLSQWNPVPPQQRTKGDLLYLTLTTLESEVFSITCHASGFFVSRLSNAHFNPALKVNEKGVCHREYVLYNLVAALSPRFATVVAANRDALNSLTQFLESYMIPSQITARYPWAVAEAEVRKQIVPDASRVQIPLFSRGVDGADVAKDWNDEFQGIKEFPRETFNERLLRDRLLNKYIQEFNQTAVATAVDIVKGNIVPLNPNEPRDKHIFLRNNIFYSFGVNATGAHNETGGDEAARYCFAKDLATVKLMNRIDVSGVCNLLSCNVDYLGERVVCQAPVPGVFADQTDEEGKPVDKVVYGYSLDENTVRTEDKFTQVLKPVAEAFHWKPHTIELASGATSESELMLSKDVKGIMGTDGRKYVIDMHRSTPLDITFLDAHYNDLAESYPHREASLRHEAVEEWYKRKAAAIFKVETEKLEQEGVAKDGEKPQVAIPYDQITFNPDAFTGVNEADEDRQTVREMSELVSKHLIPEFLDDVAKNAVPYDGAQLSDYMHKSGINIRYLGAIVKAAQLKIETHEATVLETIKANEAELERRSAEEEEKKETAEEEKKDEKEEEEKKSSAASMVPVVANMNALHIICVQEMVARGVKHVLRKTGNDVPLLLKPHFIAHIHNCLLGTQFNDAPTVDVDEVTKSLFASSDLSFADITPEAVRKLVEEEVLLRYRHRLAENWHQNVKPLQMLREIALKFGIQWKARKYAFTKEDAEEEPEVPREPETKGKKGKKKVAPVVETTKRSSTFTADDVVAFVPLVRDSSYRCSLVDEVFETARIQIQDGDKQVGLDLLAELVAFYQQIYGAVNAETTGFYSTLAQIYAECEMHSEASIVARKAAIQQERLAGIDSYETINAYVKASFYDSLNKDPVSAFKLNSKAYQDWCAIYGEEHPNTVNTLSNFATILQELKLTGEAKQFFTRALELSVQLNGELSDITGIIRHRLAVLLVQITEYSAALEQFNAAADIFNKLVGPDDALSKECTKFAKNLSSYMAYTEHQKAEQKKALAQQAKAKAPVVKAPAAKAKKGKNVPQADPEIASKSVDEILQFINGPSKKSKKKLKK